MKRYKWIEHGMEPDPKGDWVLYKEIPPNEDREKGTPFDEPIYNPECKDCGYQNSENCNTCDKISKNKTKRRNRKDCTFHGIDSKRCASKKCKHIYCIGVNCGCFQPKTK